MTDQLLQYAKEQLHSGNFTCVLWDGVTALTTQQRGIQPLRGWLGSEKDVSAFVAADRVVGKAAAYLYVLLKIKAVYAEIVSKPAQEVLARYGIPLEYGTLVDAIQNRAKDGFCPMERAVWEIDSPEQALVAIERTYQALTKKETP